MNKTRYDLIIAGAGMVGSCAALALAKKGFHVALVEAAAGFVESALPDRPFDLRVSAISPTSQAFLTQLGVWPAIHAARICHYGRMRIWHQKGDARLSFDSAELARPGLGAIVENREMLQALSAACMAQPKIEWFRPDRIASIDENNSRNLAVTLKSGMQLTADGLIVADGRNSPTRQLAGIEIMSGDYRQTAIVANVTTERPHQQTAWQRFLCTGPLAFLPLSNGECSIVWSCDTEFANELLQMDNPAFCRVLTRSFEATLGNVQTVSERRSFPLGWHSCDEWLKNRVLVIGDAAHSVHPLAGQGVNLGFSDVSRLVEVMAISESCWNKKNLRRFERERKSQTVFATHALSGLKWVFGLHSEPVGKVLDSGMKLIQANACAKRMLMQQAIKNMV